MEERLYGTVPDCGTCERPELSPGNLLAWEIYQALNSGFCLDFTVDILEVFRFYRVRRPALMLQKLALIYGVARKNAEKQDK